MSNEVTLQDAYAKACLAIGELTVTNRLLSDALARAEQEPEPSTETKP